MTALVISVVLISWIASAIVRKADKKRRAEEIARISAEIRQQKAEQKRQATEQARQAKELEKHEAMLLKHEEEIRKLNTQITIARKDIEDETANLSRLYGLLDIAEQKQRDAHPGSKSDEAAMRKVMSLNKQISASEKRIIKAKATIENAERKLEAA